MGTRSVGVTDLASGAGVAEFRTRERTDAAVGIPVVEQYVLPLLPMHDRVVSFLGSASTFRVVGSGSANQVMATLFNATGSGVLVALRAVVVQYDYASTAGGTARNSIVSRLTTAPTGGTAHTPMSFDTAKTHNASVTVLGGASADGVASAITATLGTTAWGHEQEHAAGTPLQIRMWDKHAIPALSRDDPPYLREGEGIAVSMALSATVAHAVVNLAWEEFTLP